MRWCIQCRKQLTIEEIIHELQGKCFDCWLPKPKSTPTPEQLAEYWRSNEAMQHD